MTGVRTSFPGGVSAFSVEAVDFLAAGAVVVKTSLAAVVVNAVFLVLREDVEEEEEKEAVGAVVPLVFARPVIEIPLSLARTEREESGSPSSSSWFTLRLRLREVVRDGGSVPIAAVLHVSKCMQKCYTLEWHAREKKKR